MIYSVPEKYRSVLDQAKTTSEIDRKFRNRSENLRVRREGLKRLNLGARGRRLEEDMMEHLVKSLSVLRFVAKVF